MKVFLLLLIVFLLGFAGVEWTQQWQNKSALGERLTDYLDVVDESSIDQVKQDLIHDARQWGIDLTPEEIQITYRDTERLVASQKLVGRLAEFQNKEISIDIRYELRVLGLGVAQEVSRSKIRPVATRQRVRPEYEELLR